jgi:hypothetical protein
MAQANGIAEDAAVLDALQRAYPDRQMASGRMLLERSKNSIIAARLSGNAGTTGRSLGRFRGNASSRYECVPSHCSS